MTHRRHHHRDAVAGFTLIEALVATVLMGLVMTGLAAVTAQWLPNWDRGFLRAQRSELVSIAIDRLVADLAASEFVTASRDTTRPLFDGTPTAVTLVRSAYGPNAQPGLERVRIAETSDRDGIVLVRSHASFAPLPPGTPATGLVGFSDPVALVRAPLRVTFAYAGRDGVWKNAWQNASLLPATVRVTVRDAVSDRTLSISTAALVHVELPAACVTAKDKSDCSAQPDRPGNQAPNGQAPQNQGAPAAPAGPQNPVRDL